jgi:hypothetical protein
MGNLIAHLTDIIFDGIIHYSAFFDSWKPVTRKIMELLVIYRKKVELAAKRRY